VRMLRGARVIATRRQGRQVFCSLDRQSIAAYQERFDAVVAGRALAPEPVSPQPAPLPS